MAAKKQSRGKCAFCGLEAAKSGMTRHLSKCPEWLKAARAANEKVKEKDPEILLYLRVQDAYNKAFWLDLEMTSSATLKKLDVYLRAIWLECCGHLSEFSPGGWGSGKIGMNRKAFDVFDDYPAITHIYDFGTESVTTITLLGMRKGVPLTKHPITLLARNLMPEVTCSRCEKPGTHLAMELVIENDEFGVVCPEHAKEFEESDYGCIPLVNSPRLGLCGYDGPAEPPYLIFSARPHNRRSHLHHLRRRHSRPHRRWNSSDRKEECRVC